MDRPFLEGGCGVSGVLELALWHIICYDIELRGLLSDEFAPSIIGLSTL